MNIDIESVKKSRANALNIAEQKPEFRGLQKPREFWRGYAQGLNDVERGCFRSVKADEKTQAQDTATGKRLALNALHAEVVWLQEAVARGIITKPEDALAYVIRKIDEAHEATDKEFNL